MIIYQWGLDWSFLPACLQLELAETGAYQKHIRHCPAAPFGLTSSRAAEKRKEQRKQLVNATKMQQGIARGIGGDREGWGTALGNNFLAFLWPHTRLGSALPLMLPEMANKSHL